MTGLPRGTGRAKVAGRKLVERRQLRLETLETRCLMAADTSDPFAGLLTHGGACSCPICSGDGLMALQPQSATATTAAAATWSASATPTGVPQLNSRLGAKATLFLDFNGNVEASWGASRNVVTPAYDTDGNYASFSAAELANIREIWARVSEDYAPFNINVTTVAPPLIADRVAAKIVIGGSYSDWFGSSAGGVAYVGGFANGASNVGFVFEDALGNGSPRYVAEAATHEAGHLFGLSHQASWSGGQLASEYYAGTSTWAPIMGVGYYAERTTWNRGPTTAGASSVQDDMAILAGSANGFGYVADDFGNLPSTAAALPVSGSSISASGLIGRGDDRDVFRLTTSGGTLNLSLGVAGVGANLDGTLELLNSSGQTITVASPAGSLGAALSRSLTAGTYYVVVRGNGSYGNVGRYKLSGTLGGSQITPVTPPPPTTPPPTTPPPTSPTPTPPTASTRIIDNGSAGFTTSGVWQRATGVGSAGDINWAAAGSTGATANWTFTNLAPGQYRVAASWPGSKLYSSAAPFSIYAGNRMLTTVRVNQERAASTFNASSTLWQNLGTFTVSANSLTVRLGSDKEGRVIADAIRLERVFATSGGTLVRSGALLPAEELAMLLPETAAADPRSEIDDVLFAPSGDDYVPAAVQQHQRFAQPAADPLDLWSGADDDATDALLADLAGELLA